MATARQIAANRANAQKSTGPVTPEGKAKSCLNRLSHGFTRSNVFLAFEKSEEFNALLSDLIDHFHPAGIVEQILVEKMAQNQWVSLRATSLQSLLLNNATVNDHALPKDFSALLRYQAAADRAFHKAHAELLKSQKERGRSEIGFESQKSEDAAETSEKTAQDRPPAYVNQPTSPEFIPSTFPSDEEANTLLARKQRKPYGTDYVSL